MRRAALILLIFLPLAALAQAKSEPAKPPSSDSRQSQQAEGFGVDQQEVGENGVVRVRTSLVTVPVAVVDADGRYIYDLRREDFHILEDGVEQEVTFFADAEQPLAIVFLIDTSVSVSSSWRAIGEALEDFVSQLRPRDTVFPIVFDSTIRIPLAHSTSDPKLLLSTIREALSKPSEGSGATHLYDVIDLVNKHVLTTAKGARKAVIIFSDGMDSGSRVGTLKGTLNDASEVGALYYVLYFEPGNPVSNDLSISGQQMAAKVRGAEYLRALTEKTGGRFIRVERRYPDLRRQSFRMVGEELRHLYSLGYYPKNKAPSNKRRQIRVKVARAGAKAQARKSYIFESPDK